MEFQKSGETADGNEGKTAEAWRYDRCIDYRPKREFSCIAYLKDEGFLSIDNNGYPIFIIYGNVRIDNSPGDSYRVAVPLHYRNRKVWQFCCFTGKENIQKAHAAADGAEKVIFTAAGREKITLKMVIPHTVTRATRCFRLVVLM